MYVKAPNTGAFLMDEREKKMALISKERLINDLARKKYDIEVMQKETPGWNDLLPIVHDAEPVGYDKDGEVEQLIYQILEDAEMSFDEIERLLDRIYIQVANYKQKAVQGLKFQR